MFEFQFEKENKDKYENHFYLSLKMTDDFDF